jgi:predicted phosphodiesterase
MANQLKTTIFILLVTLVGCGQHPDFSGLFYSPSRVDNRFVQSDEWNKNHIVQNLIVSSENYQLLVAGDSHVGELVNFNKMLVEANKPENSAMIMVGDIVTGKKEDYTIFKNALPNFNEVPYFLMIGNHDLYFDGWKTFYDYFGSSTYYFTVETPLNNDLYICLDSGAGTLGGKQLAWLKNLLSSDRKNYRNCILFSHVNFFREHRTGSTNPLKTELEVLLPLFAKYRVNMVIMGHDHKRVITEFGNTTYITMDALKDGVHNASILKLQVSENKIGYTFQELN